jgi:hypothetical protein
MVLTGHVHNYQRIEFVGAGIKIPFFVIGNGGYWNLHHIGMKVGGADAETGAKLMAGVDTRHGFVTFGIDKHKIIGHLTTVPRPHESWSEAESYNEQADVFSYPADSVFLNAGQQIELLPAGGSQLPPEPAMPGSGHGRSKGKASKAKSTGKKTSRKKKKSKKKRL